MKKESIKTKSNKMTKKTTNKKSNIKEKNTTKKKETIKKTKKKEKLVSDIGIKKIDLEELDYKNTTAIVFIILTGVIFLYSLVFVSFDGNWNEDVNIICLIVAMTMIALVGSKEYKKIANTITITLFILSISNIIYYNNFSMKIEPLYHLHKKYNIPYSDMKVIETSKRKVADAPFLGDNEYRGAIIEYDGYKINVYYNGGWQDNYASVSAYNESYKELQRKLTSIIESYCNNVKVVKDPQIYRAMETWDKSDKPEFGYIIYLNTSDENVVENVIRELDDYVDNASDDKNLFYGLYIIKNKEFYDELINKNVDDILGDGEVIDSQTNVIDLFENFDYTAARITSHEHYDKDIFINDGDEKDSQYQSKDNFNNIVFYYTARDFDVYGIE